MIARRSTLVLPKGASTRLRTHLYPGDGLEAAALLLCAAVHGSRRKYLVQDILEVPYASCACRERDRITWPGEYLELAIDRAESQGLTVIAAHSHPGGLFAFSGADDISDQMVMPALFHGTGRECGAAIMTPDGAIRARLYGKTGLPEPVDLVMEAGDDLRFWWDHNAKTRGPQAPPMPFTASMADWLRRLSVCVIGVSGTGSIVAEQLARLGFGEIILIDFDRVEARNLNRILNSSLADAEAAILKVAMFAKAIRRYRPDCEVIEVAASLGTREAVLAASQADLLFSCVDTAEARHIADRICASLAMPVFDVGVTIPTHRSDSGARAVAEVCGRIDYIHPGGSSLLSRGVYDEAVLEAEYLARHAPETHRRKLDEGYLRGMAEQAPAVITLNMRAASACVMEFIARAFPFRQFPNERWSRTIFMLADGDEEHQAESDFFPGSFPLAAGLCEPLLGLPALSEPARAA
jgi:ThiF family/Prokaryotic homologs of the JAB domain